MSVANCWHQLNSILNSTLAIPSSSDVGIIIQRQQEEDTFLHACVHTYIPTHIHMYVRMWQQNSKATLSHIAGYSYALADSTKVDKFTAAS